MRTVIRLGLVLALVSVASMGAFAEEAVPVKLSLLPKVGIPASETVHGLNLGIIGADLDEMHGLQTCFIFSGVKQELKGVQLGFVNKGNVVTGLQYGFYNGANKVTGVQLGFINVTEEMKGVQVGLVNLIKKSEILPVMVIANAYF